MAPPLPLRAWLVESVLSAIERLPELLKMAPPRADAVLSERTQWLRFKVPPRLMPAPWLAWPSAMDNPESATVAAPLSNTREAWFPLTVTPLAPGPVMVRFSLIARSPGVAVMVPATPAW